MDKNIMIPDEIKDFFSHISEGYISRLTGKHFNIAKDGFVYLTNSALSEYTDASVRYARTGTCAGIIKNGTFRPHTALALTMRADDFDNVIDLDAKDENVCRYLKGQTLLASDVKCDIAKGYVLICVNGYGLGFCKNDGSKLKNLYEKGWILR